MVNQSTLLPLLQFVGLIAPALAILIELLVKFHGGISEIRDSGHVPVELQILFMAFVGILFGGVILGYQTITTLNSQLTKTALLMIFSGLPLLGVSLFAMNIRITTSPDGNVGLTERFILVIRRVFTIIVPAGGVIVTFSYMSYFVGGFANDLVNWWIFNSDIPPAYFFHLLFAIFAFKSLYELNQNELLPSNDARAVFEGAFVLILVLPLFIGLLTIPVFLLIFGAIEISQIPLAKNSIITSVPFIWCLIITLATLTVDFDLDEDESVS